MSARAHGKADTSVALRHRGREAALQMLYEELRGWLLTSETFANFQLVVAGVLLLLIVQFAPEGLLGFLYRRFPRLRRFLE